MITASQFKKVISIKVIFYALFTLIGAAALVRIYLSPDMWGTVLLALGLVVFWAGPQMYQFLTDGNMISKLGRTLVSNAESKFERTCYFIIYVVITFGSFYMFLTGKALLGGVKVF